MIGGTEVVSTRGAKASNLHLVQVWSQGLEIALGARGWFSGLGIPLWVPMTPRAS